MEKFKLAQQKRRLKQFLMTPIFIAVLALGWQYPILGYFIPLCMILGIGIGLYRGRKWCDWYCPRGSFYDALVSQIKRKRNIPAIFRNIYFRLGMLALLMGIMSFNLVRLWPDPLRIGHFFVVMVTVTTIIGVILGIIFHQRSWCMVCPIGTSVNLVGGKKNPLTIDSELCVECKLCQKVCPVQIKPHTFKSSGFQQVKDSDCLKCNLCLSVCPRQALSRK